jgi:dihydrofolate synthase / folylpolyglutamate synthase
VTMATGGLAAALTALYARVPLGMRLGLEPMRLACARAGHPERSFPAVHVTGTNGKGSTCAMVESIARASGMRTGLYTSPHLCRFAERIRVDGAPIDDAALTRVLERALALGPDLSFFETATLAAFLTFQEQEIELGVIEVGIGGRLDATNVLTAPRCTAITRVALDHQDRLGETLEEIAREKAGIAKPGVPLFLGPMTARARDAIAEVAAAAGARVVELDSSLPPEAAVSRDAAYQRENARMAWHIGAQLGIPEEAIVRGLAQATWPGRFERIDAADGPWLLDGAHNPDGARALVHALRGVERPGALIFGALADKAWREMLPLLAELPCPRFYVAPRGRAPAEPIELAKALPGTPAPSLAEALVLARAVAGPALVVVSGSLFLVGEARARLLGLPEDPPVAL